MALAGPRSLPSTGVARSMALACALWLCPEPASADWLITPFLGETFGGHTNFVLLEEPSGDKRLTIGAAFTLLGDGVLGAEVDFGYTPHYFRETTLVKERRVATLMGNVVVAAPQRWVGYSLRPFASGGVGLLRAAIDDLVFPIDANLFALNVGGGAIGFFDDKRGLRLDLRYFRNITGDDRVELLPFESRLRLSYWRAAAGIVLKF